MINEELKQTRLSQGISLRELEKLSGVGFSHIRRIEAGADASTSTLNKICQALGVKLTIKARKVLDVKVYAHTADVYLSYGCFVIYRERVAGMCKEEMGEYIRAIFSEYNIHPQNFVEKIVSEWIGDENH